MSASPLSPIALETSRFRYFVFISYSRKDSRVAKWLQRKLEWFRIPVKMVDAQQMPPHPKYLRPVYRDKTCLEVDNAHYWENIKNAIEQSRFLIVLCSKESARSAAVDLEVSYFLEMREKYAGRENAIDSTVPVILGERVGDGSEDDCLCPTLRDLGCAITNRNLPTMVPDGDGNELEAWDAGLVGLVSYLLKIHREELANHLRREEKRRATFTKLIAGSMSALFVMSVFASILAWRSEKRATEQRELAISSRDEAEDVLKFLIRFSRKTETGLTISEMKAEILERARDYYVNLGIDGNDPSQLSRKAVALSNLGDLYKSISDFVKAKELYILVMEIDKQLITIDSSNPEYKRGLAYSYLRIGEVFTIDGELDSANKAHATALTLLRDAVASRPNDDDFRMELALALSQFGDAIEGYELAKSVISEGPDRSQWRYDFAKVAARTALKTHGSRSVELMKESIGIMRVLLSEDPENTVYLHTLGATFKDGGILFERLALNGEAKNYYREAVEIQKQLVKLDPKNTSWKANLGRVLQRIGTANKEIIGAEAALGTTKEAASIFQDLLIIEPLNYQWRRELAVCEAKVGDLLADLGRFEDAIVNYNNCITQFRSFDKFNEINREAQGDLKVALGKASWAYLQLKNYYAAEIASREALKIAKKLSSDEPDNIQLLRGVQLALNGTGSVLLELKESGEAYQLFSEALKIGEKLRLDNSDDIRTTVDYCETLYNLGASERIQNKLSDAQNNLTRSIQLLRKLESGKSLTKRGEWLLTKVQQSLNRLYAESDIVSPAVDESVFLKSILEQHKMPGVSTVVMKSGRIVASGSAGVRRMDSQEPLTLGDRVNVGSLTKLVTAAVAGRLVDQGVIKWETRICDVFPATMSIQPEYLDVTLYELLAHRGGIREQIASGIDDEKASSTSILSHSYISEHRQKFCGVILNGPPETARGNYHYSNHGYTVAAAMLELATGDSWEEVVKEEVFDIIGMNSAIVGISYDESEIPKGPVGHTMPFGRSIAVPCDPFDENQLARLQIEVGSSGFLLCSLSDYAKFINALCTNDGIYISKASHNKIFTPWSKDRDYGCGVSILTRPWAEPGVAWNHAGVIFNQTSVFWCAPAKGFVVVAYTNCHSEGGKAETAIDEVSSRMTDLYAGERGG